jgi:hypothetical protein
MQEFHSLMSLCCPTVLGSLAAFERDFCKPIDMGNVLEATTEVVMISSKKAMVFSYFIVCFCFRKHLVLFVLFSYYLLLAGVPQNGATLFS